MQRVKGGRDARARGERHAGDRRKKRCRRLEEEKMQDRGGRDAEG